jgi:hypothetical protein
MSDEFFDRSPEQQVVVLVESATLRQAERLMQSCEHCNEEDAQIPFDNILDRITGSDLSVTDYILEEPAKCGVETCLKAHKCTETHDAYPKQ